MNRFRTQETHTNHKGQQSGRLDRALLVLSLLLGLNAHTAIVPEPVTLSLAPSGDVLQLAWSTQSVITNAGRTPIYPTTL